MAQPETFSFSRVTTFEQCPRRYRYRYLDGVREAFQSIEAFMGQQVHATVEWLYNQRLAGHEHAVEAAVGRYCTEFDKAHSAGKPAVRVIRADMATEHYRRSGAEMLADFHRRRFVADGLETVAMERHFQLDLGAGVPFQGYIDRLARDADGVFHIIDFKTGARVPARFEGKDADQLDAYALALFTQTDADELVLELEYLRTATAHAKRVRRDQTEEVRRRLSARIAAARSATVFPPIPGSLCDWCGFNDLCEAYPSRRVGSARSRD
ncbi:MAG: PD-(D/E)XK nuclease family protein [Deltaproteobacteria bacterium]|nr:PD-(D/E)XK nuclease family protein [Deltaproteobacteria bacterium]